MRIIPAPTKTFDEFKKEQRIRVKLVWIKSKKYLYMKREDRRLLEGMEVMGNWVLNEIFRKDK